VPLYIQVSEAIKRTIVEGKLRAGSELPSEGQLCETYGVSRITVRQAIAELLSEGTVTRSRPRGPLLVNPPRILREVTQASGPFVEAILVGNVARHTELIAKTVERAPAYPATQLGLAIGAPVYRIELLHLGDDEPLCRQVSWVPEAVAPGFLDHDVTRGSLRWIFERKYNLLYDRKLQRISARVATNEESALLGIERRAPVLELERKILITGGRAIELVIYALRADRFSIVSDLGRPPDLPEANEAADQFA
jgi:DNA-binding GntR family transcriptional regulator